MPLNRNALIRYKTIDKCLQNRFRRWTLEDLIEACSEALYEYEGKMNPVGKRTVQADIQVMRSEKIGYNAPIEVVERKYYTYSDPEYSITKSAIGKKDLQKLSEFSDLMKQFKGFMQFNEMDLLLQKLDDVVNAQKTNSKPVIHLETNSNLKGLEFLEVIYKMIINKQVMEINYQSFKAKRPGKIIFHPYLLKEYRNRWFVLGRKGKDQPILNLALDRIHSIGINSQLAYIEDKNFHPEEYYKNLVGVTHTGHRPVNVHLFVGSEHAPYVLTKPLHHTQQLVNESDEGVEIVIKVVPNLELEREILGFGEHMKVLAPESLKSKIQYKLKKAVDNYEDTERIS